MNPNLQKSLMSTLGYPGTAAKPAQSPYVANGYALVPPKPAASAPSAYDAQIAALEAEARNSAAELKKLQQQALAAPKIYSYDFAGASAKARAAAANAVNPYYTQQLNKFLEGERIKQQRAQEDAATGTKQVDEALQDALEASGIQRERTTQDVTTKLGDIQNSSDYYQDTEGNTFDKARSALMTNLAQSGLTTSGLGQQQQNEQVTNRNVESAQQTRSFNAQKEAVNTLKTRTFEDLGRSDTLGQRNAGQQKGLIKVDLDRAIQDIDRNIDAGKAKNEYDRLQALYAEEGKQYQLGVNQFLQALQGKARAQDLIATKQFLGG
jgi:hypothetical protein